jgi:D-3-phosphoglycerate dehydrogenase
MFGAKELATVRTDALVVNTSRGDVVHFDDVCTAVAEGRLGGFAADVFPEEPMDTSRWRGVPGLYFTPHIGGNAREAVLAMGRSAIGHVAAYLKTAREESHDRK